MFSNSNPIYDRSKRFLPLYQEFFAALFKIPDKDVQNRVTDAINGTVKCSVCKRKTEFREFATQTESLPETESRVMDIKETTSTNQRLFQKRRRKRKRNCPKVVKSAQHSSWTPMLQQDNPPINEDKSQSGSKRRRSGSIISTNSEDAAINVFFQNDHARLLDFEQNSDNVENIMNKMSIEYLTCDKRSSVGLLPIHEAIVANDVKRLQRQIYVWKYRKVNLMELLTDDDDNPFQFAIKENCLKPIIDKLLEQDIQLNDLDRDCNTVIHLAVAHLTGDDSNKQKDLDSLESILKKVDLEMLLEQNYDGLTALHMAVKNNQYLMVERIVNVIDNRLNLSCVVPLNDLCADQKKFTRYYCRQCDSFEGRQQNDLKSKILNAAAMKNGYTALLFAMEMRYEHLIYLLMAHMCNPNIRNLSGIDSKTYYMDHVQDKSPQIIGALEALSAVLQK